MEFPRVEIKTQEEAIRQYGGMEMFAQIEEFARQIGRAVDTAIIELLDSQVGKDCRLEDVSMVLSPVNDSTHNGSRYGILYKDRHIGTIRNTVAVQGNKAIGNIYVELTEEVKTG